MQTIYYSTDNFIHHSGNVVDFAAYRDKLAAAQQVAPCADSTAVWYVHQEEPEAPALAAVAPVYTPRVRRSARRNFFAIMLDVAATLGILVMTVTVTFHVLGI